MNQYLKIFIISVLILMVFLLTSEDLLSQCPMCRLSAEQNLKDGGTAGKGLNKGILYMLSLPYILVSTLGFIWYKNRKKLSEDIYDPPFSQN